MDYNEWAGDAFRYGYEDADGHVFYARGPDGAEVCVRVAKHLVYDEGDVKPQPEQELDRWDEI